MRDGVRALALRMTTTTTSEIVARLERLDTCVVSDALDALELPGVVPGLVPLWECGRVAGSVHTVLLREVGDVAVVAGGPHLGARAIEASAPGEVVVVANAGRLGSAAWGGLLSAGARVRGIAAAVIDGASRDVDEAVSLGFPLFARAATPVSARGRTVEEATDVPVAIGEVVVVPGDFVLADRSGVVFIARAVVSEVLDRAERLTARERSMHEEIERGASITTVMDGRYESMLTTPQGEAGVGPADRGGAHARG